MADVVGTAVVNIVPNTTQFNNALTTLGYSAQTAIGGAAATGMAAFQTNLIKAQAGLKVAGDRATALGRGMTGLTVAAGVFGAVGLKAAYDFDTSMRRVGAITRATGEEFDKLDALAQKLGRDTEFTASQAADGMVELSLAGFSVDEILKSISGTLRLASAGGVELAEATQIAANALRAYNLDAAEVGRVNDVMTATFTNANTNLSQLAEAFRYVAPVASTSGLEFEQVTAALGSMGNAGFQGSYGGTALRTAIAKLEKPTKEGAKVLERLGVVTKETDGSLRPLVEIVKEFERTGLSTADAITLLGVRAGPGFLALVGRGSKELERLTTINRRAGEEINIAAKAMEFSQEQLSAMTAAFDFTQPAVQSFGFSLDETSAILALFIDNGVSAADASRTLVDAMRATTNDAILPLIGATRDLNGNLVNSDGQVMEFAEVLAILESNGFTTADSLAMLGIEGEALAKIIQLPDEAMVKLTEKFREGGRAADIAREQMEGIKGGLKRLKSSVEAIGIVAFGGKDGLINKLGDVADAIAVWLNTMMETNPKIVKFTIYAVMLGGALGVMARVVGIVLRGLGSLVGVFRILLTPILSLLGTIGRFVVLLKTTGSLAVTLSAMVNPVGLVIGAILLLGAAIAIAYAKSEPFREFVDGLVDKLQILWDNLWRLVDLIVQQVEPSVERLSGPFMRLGEVLLGIYVSPLIGALETLVRFLSGDTEGALEKARETFDRFKQKIAELPGVVITFVDTFFTEFARLTDVGQTAMDSVFNGMLEAVQDIPVIGPIVDTIIDQMKAAFGASTGLGEVISGIFTLDPALILEGLGSIVSSLVTFLVVDLPTGLINFVADIGAALEPVISGALTWLGDNLGTVVEGLKDFPGKVYDAIAGAFKDDPGDSEAIAGNTTENPTIGLMDRMFASLEDWAKNNAERKWREALENLFNVDWGTVIGGALLIGVGQVLTYMYVLPAVIFAFLGAVIAGAVRQILPLIGGALDWVATELPGYIEGALRGIGDQLYAGFEQTFASVGLEGMGESILSGISSFVTGAFNLAATAGEAIIQGLLSGLNWIAEQGDYLINLFLDYVWYPFLEWLGIESPSTRAAEVGLNIIMGLLNGMQTAIGTVWNWLITVPGTILGLLGDLGSILLGWFTTAFNWVAINGPIILTNVGLWLMGLPGRILAWLGNLGSTLMGWFSTAWNWVATNAPTAVSGLVAWLTGLPGTLITTLGDLGGRIFSWLKGAFDTVVTRGGEIISGALTWIRGVPGQLAGALSGAAGAFGGLVSKVVGLWPFAEGGIVRVPTPALVGEAGPEVIIPLTDPDRAKQLVMQSGLMGLIGGQPMGGIAAGGTGFTVAPPPTDVGGVPAASAGVTTAMSTIAGSALMALQPVGDWFTTAGTQAAESMVLFGEQVWTSTEPGLTVFSEQFKLVFTTIMTFLTTWIAQVNALFVPFGLGLWTSMSAGMALFRLQFEQVFNALTIFVNSWVTNIRTAFTALPAYFSGISAQITAALGSPFKTFASGIWNPFASALNSALRQIPATAGITISSLPTAHSGGIIGERLPQTGGPLGSDEMIVKMQRGEGVIPAAAMKDLTPAEFEAIRSGGGLMMAKPQTDAYVRVPGTGQPYGPVAPAAQGMAASGFVDGVVVQNLKAAAAQVSGSIRSLLSGFFMSRFLGGVSSTFVDESVKFVESKVAEQNRKAMEAIGAGDAFPGGLPIGLDTAIARVAAMRGQGGSYRTLIDYMRATGVPHVVTSTVRPGSRVRGSGRVSLHSAPFRAVDFAGPSGGRDTPELLRIYRAFAPVRNLLAEIIYSGPGGNYFGRTGATADDHHDHVHVGLANGAIVSRPMSALLGESGPEVVLPLTRPMRALQLAQQSGLFSVLAEAQESTLTAAGGGTFTPTPAAGAAGGDTGLFPGGPGNTYNIYGISIEQVRAEIRAREEAAARTQFVRR
jgi:TP901 family phage tail tape measure protein